MLRKEMTIYDNSLTSVEMTIWGDSATHNYPEGSILAISNVRVSDYRTVSLSANNQSDILLDPAQVPEVESLRKWTTSEVQNLSLTCLTTGGRLSLSNAPFTVIRALTSD